MGRATKMITSLTAVLVVFFGHAAAMIANSAVADRALARSSAEMKQMEAEVESAVKVMRQGLTLEKAVAALKKTFNATPAFVSMLQEISHPQPRRLSRKPSHGSQFLGVAKDHSDPYSGVAA